MIKIKEHEALFIFSLTGLGYLCTYIFQWGQFHYYSIPRSFIEINLNTIVDSLVFILILLMLSSFHLEFIKKNNYLKGAKNFLITKARSYNLIFQFTLVFAICALAFIAMISDYNPYYFLMMLFLLMMYLLLKNYQYLFAVSYVSFILLSVFVIGYSTADNESDYLVMTDQSLKKSYVVLHVQGGKAIVAEMNLKKNLIYPDYQLIKFETNKLNEHKLKLEKLEGLEVQRL
ncbi:hypothetical protein [Exiguobacterium sp. s142]|uniref:hypothetical protein n=1 Tax=Exiguobacterium sp. s142 TaxID=2751222 RepID=UPI001BE8BCF5|nr:hypothetical protein [Exiguobacterium sp. s142]